MSVAVETAETIGDVLRAATEMLAAAGVPEPRADAEVLLACALETDRTKVVVHASEPFPVAAGTRLSTLLEARRRRVPVFHLVGRREFWSLDLAVDARVLTPRPETELVVETARSVAPTARVVVDAGTGSGAIAIAISREVPGAQVIAVDVDADALDVAAENCARLAPTVALVRASWMSALRTASVDLVVANPPYVPDVDIEGLAPEVRDHEPRRALAGGADGLRDVRCVLKESLRVLRPGGWLVLEVGQGQAERVRYEMSRSRWEPDVLLARDLAGVDRVVAGRRGA